MRPKVSWNAKARRFAFRTENGGYGFLSESSVRKIVDQNIDVTGARMAKLGSDLKSSAQAFKDGTITEAAYRDAVKDYRDSMAAQIKGAHVGQAMAAVGGADQMTQADFGRTGGLLRPQYRYLENMCAEFAGDPDIVLGNVSGKQSIEDRSASYSQASRLTFEAVADASSGENGQPYVVNILEKGAHHCVAKSGNPFSSCPGQTLLGVVKYDDIRRLPPGRRVCQNWCKCGSRRFATLKAAIAALGAHAVKSWDESQHPRDDDGKFGSGGTRITSVSHAEEVLLGMGVLKVKLPSNKEMAQLVVDAAELVHQNGGKLPSHFGVLKGEKRTVAVMQGDSILISNKTSLTPEKMKDQVTSGFWSQSNPVLHELGHYNNLANIGQTPDDSAPEWPPPANMLSPDQDMSGTQAREIADEVSGYATNEPREFVAETFAGHLSGKRYSPNVMALYYKYGGSKLNE